MAWRTRPVIGITGPDHGGGAAWLAAALAVLMAGGRPRRIRPRKSTPIDHLDGLIVGGGADVDPSLYGIPKEPPTRLEELRSPSRPWHTTIATLLLYPLVLTLRWLFSTKKQLKSNRARDELEMQLIADAMEHDLPVLGICRGMQLLNVYFGGDLHRELDDFYAEVPQTHGVWPHKPVTILSRSRLHDIVGGQDMCRVNSLHNQAVNATPPDLQVAAWETHTDVIQAIEHRHRRCVLGVQWHPEYLPQMPEQRRLFQHLVACAKRQCGD